MTAQERAELGDLRAEVRDGFKEIRTLNLDMIQRIARLEAAAQTAQTSVQFRLMQAGILISLASAVYNIFLSK